MPGVNPLERGKNLDVLLKTLMEAGITTAGLQFLLGVNPDTLSAYLLRASQEGSLYSIPGPDILTAQQEYIELIPTNLYWLAATITFPTVRLIGPRKYALHLLMDDGGNLNESPTLVLSCALPSGDYSLDFSFPFNPTQMAEHHIWLPTSTVSISATGRAEWGTTRLQASLIPIPIGV